MSVAGRDEEAGMTLTWNDGGVYRRGVMGGWVKVKEVKPMRGVNVEPFEWEKRVGGCVREVDVMEVEV